MSVAYEQELLPLLPIHVAGNGGSVGGGVISEDTMLPDKDSSSKLSPSKHLS